ncbi:MAG: DUF2330 domain-containing protein [Myxococcales bacterium]|nr:DUF2330 domain-containing protein [Myxococcales bacterium]
MLTLLVAGWTGVAHAFCGTFVGAPGSQLTNRSSQVVLARENGTTTLTLVADYAGDLADFAMVLPVPADLDPQRVRVIEPVVVDRLDRYSTPRRVEYACANAVTFSHDGVYTNGAGCTVLFGCGASDVSGYGLSTDVVGGQAAGSVTVEAEFSVAEYDVVLLSATGADGLYAWLGKNGFALPEGGEDVLDTYIDGGASFLAAKVSLEVAAEGPRRLSPLQLAYESPSIGLPIRIGTISAAAEQEVVVYGLTSALEGEMQIRNYPEVVVEDECMWRSGTDFTEFYVDQISRAQEAVGASWFTEYSWTLYQEVPSVKCDPCTVEVQELYDQGELQDLGLGTSSAHLTRMRMIYRPSEIGEDLEIGLRPLQGNRQMRFIEYERQLEFLFPVCGEGFAEEPGQCGDDGLNAIELDGSHSMLPGAALVGMGALALSIVRRRDA